MGLPAGWRMINQDFRNMSEGSRTKDDNGKPPLHRLRLTFAKGETLTYISHLDLARTWERTFRRARLPVAFSQGFNPRPRFQIAAALPVGVTGRAELLDLWLEEPLDPHAVRSRLESVLPQGLEVLEVTEVDLGLPSLQSQMRAADYRVMLRSQESVEAIQARIRVFLEASMHLRQRQHKGGWQTYDLRPLVQSLTVADMDTGASTEEHGSILETGSEPETVLTMRLQASPQGAGRPDEVLDALGLSATRRKVERTNLALEFDK